MKFDSPILSARGQSTFDFLNGVVVGLGDVSKKVDAAFAQQCTVDGDFLTDIDANARRIEKQLGTHRVFRVSQLVGDWHARNHGPVAIDAFEQIEPELRPAMVAAEHGPASLTLDPDAVPPAYWDKVAFHRTGAWDSHPDMGYIHGELVHKGMVAKLMGSDILAQRKQTAARAPRRDYADILDMGCSSGHFTNALQLVFPDARIVGVDLSPRMLEHAWRVANLHGWAWELHQADAQHTGFADASFDLAASYILLHEIPAETIRGVFAEAFRVLRPGGDMIMADVPRYGDMDALAIWKADRAARFGGEPHWRESAQVDLAAVARDAGFVEVTTSGPFPYVVQGHKPA